MKDLLSPQQVMAMQYLSKWIILGVIALVVAIAALVYFFWQNPQTAPADQGQITLPDDLDTDDENYDYPIDGMIFLSLISGEIEGDEGSFNLAVPAILDIFEGTITDFPPHTIDGQVADRLQYHISPAGDSYVVTFLGVTDDGTGYGVYRARKEGLDTDLIATLEGAKHIAGSDDIDFFKQYPHTTQYGDVLYASLSREKRTASEGTGDIAAEEWNIYLVEGDEEKQLLTHGLYPKWVDTLNFAFLKNDGVYLYNIEINEEQLIYPTDHTLTAANGFDVSNDGDIFALTHADFDDENSGLTVVTMSDWFTGAVASEKHVNGLVRSPVISPDGEYVAHISHRFETNGDEEEFIPDIAYYVLSSGDYLWNFSPFDTDTINSIYLTDWQY